MLLPRSLIPKGETPRDLRPGRARACGGSPCPPARDRSSLPSRALPEPPGTEPSTSAPSGLELLGEGGGGGAVHAGRTVSWRGPGVTPMSLPGTCATPLRPSGLRTAMGVGKRFGAPFLAQRSHLLLVQGPQDPPVSLDPPSPQDLQQSGAQAHPPLGASSGLRHSGPLDHERRMASRETWLLCGPLWTGCPGSPKRHGRGPASWALQASRGLERSSGCRAQRPQRLGPAVSVA